MIPDPTDSTAASPVVIEAPLVRTDPHGTLCQRTVAAVWPPLVVLGLVIGLWYFVSYVGMSDHRRFLVPPPHEVVDEGFVRRRQPPETARQRVVDHAGGRRSDSPVSIILGVSIAAR